MTTMKLINELQYGKRVHCRTREEAGAFLHFLDSVGYSWPSSRSATEIDHWDQFGAESVYGLSCTEYGFQIMYDTADHCSLDDIISFPGALLSTIFPIQDIILVIENDERTGEERNLLMTLEDVINAYFAIGDVDEDRMTEIVKAANDLGETKTPWKSNSWAELEFPDYACIEASTYTHVSLRYCQDLGQLLYFLLKKFNACPAMASIDLDHSHAECVKVAEDLGLR